MEIFSKKLTKTDVGFRLSMETRSLLCFPGFEMGQNVQILKFKDVDTGELWSFRLFVRRGKYKKPVISGGNWAEFVRVKKLGIGDRIQFLKEEEYEDGAITTMGGVKYKVKVKKPVTIFKAVIGYVF